MRFGVLGPVQVIDSAGRTISTAGTVRTLLAALLLRANQTVTVGELVEDLWDVNPPTNPRPALQTYVSRLRAALGADDELIRTTTTGYQLRVDSRDVDLLQFRSWVAAAMSERAAEVRTGLLRQALELWRGEPLAGITAGSRLRDYVPRLVDERLHATELYFDARLESGHAAEITAELTELTKRHPQRERFWALLIRALYHAGRQGEALAAYRRLSDYLRDELGVNPALELRELHQAILDRDAILDPPTGSDTRSPVAAIPRPHQLPADVDGFTGRGDELRMLDALLPLGAETRHVVVAAIDGAAGIGKSAFALHWAHRNRDLFPDGQLYLNLRGYGSGQPMEPAVAVETLIRSLGMPANRIPAELEGRSSMLRTLIAGKRLLVVLDNARSADQVRPLLPGSDSMVLVTSRSQLRGLVAREGAHRITLDHLDDADSMAMLGRIIGDRATAEPGAVAELARLCRGLPLALAIAAERTTREPDTRLAELVVDLRDEHHRLELPHNGQDPESDLRGVFSWSYRALSEQAADLFRLLGLAPGPDISAPAAAALAGVSVAHASRLLDQLVNANQIHVKRTGRYEMHDLVRAYASDLSDEYDQADHRMAAQQRLINWLISTAFNGRPLLQPSESDVVPKSVAQDTQPLEFSGERQAHEWFDAERHNLAAAVHRAHELGYDEACWQLAYLAWVHLHLCGGWDDIIATHQIGLSSARRAADPTGQGRMLTGLGVAYRATGSIQLAVEAQHDALRVFRRHRNQMGEAAALSNLGAACRDAGRYADALRYARQALAIERERGEPGNVAISLYQIALTLTSAGQPADAIRVAAECLDTFRAIGHRGGEARALRAIAAAHTQIGSFHIAIDHYRTAVDCYQQLGDLWSQAAALTELGNTFAAAGSGSDSRSAWKRAQTIVEELGAPGTEELRRRLGLPAPADVRTNAGPTGTATE